MSDDRAVNYYNNVQQKVTVADSPDEFVINKPTRKDKSYDDFLSFLYRNDKVKPKFKREISFTDNNDLTRGRRALVFRWVINLRISKAFHEKNFRFKTFVCVQTTRDQTSEGDGPKKEQDKEARNANQAQQTRIIEKKM